MKIAALFMILALPAMAGTLNLFMVWDANPISQQVTNYQVLRLDVTEQGVTNYSKIGSTTNTFYALTNWNPAPVMFAVTAQNEHGTSLPSAPSGWPKPNAPNPPGRLILIMDDVEPENWTVITIPNP